MTYHGIWDTYELYDINKDSKQMDNLLGEVAYGMKYENYVRHAKKQLGTLAPTMNKLDNRINVLLEQTDGQRRPNWNKK